MRTVNHVLSGFFSVVFLLGGVMLVMPFGSEAEAGGHFKKIKNHKRGSNTYFKKFKNHKRVSNKDLQDLILMLKEQIDNLPSGSGEGDGNHTLRWDTVLDSTNGSTEPGAEGCNSDRFKCIMPTAAFPDGEAVVDLQTGIVWDRAPHDTRAGADASADDRQTWANARLQCGNREIGGQKGNRLPSHAELGSLVDTDSALCTGGGPCLPDRHPFKGVQSSFYWSAATNAFSHACVVCELLWRRGHLQ